MATRTDIDPWADQDARSVLGYNLPSRQAPLRPSVSANASAQQRASINPAIADAVTELAISLGGQGSGEEREMRMQILMEDLSKSMDPETVRAAFEAGKDEWEYLPTKAKVVAAAQPYLAERRAKMRADRENCEADARKRLPPPTYADPRDSAAIMAETFARIDAATRNLMGRSKADVTVPYGERPLRSEPPAVSDLSDAMRALRDRTTDTAGNVTQRVG